MSVQDFKESQIAVEYISKKGKQMCHYINIPIGRKIREACNIREKRLALKASREAKEKSRYATIVRKGDTLSTGHICTSTTTLDTLNKVPYLQITF